MSYLHFAPGPSCAALLRGCRPHVTRPAATSQNVCHLTHFFLFVQGAHFLFLFLTANTHPSLASICICLKYMHLKDAIRGRNSTFELSRVLCTGQSSLGIYRHPVDEKGLPTGMNRLLFFRVAALGTHRVKNQARAYKSNHCNFPWKWNSHTVDLNGEKKSMSVTSVSGLTVL